MSNETETVVIHQPSGALIEGAATMLAVSRAYAVSPTQWVPEMREAAGEDLQRVKRLAKDIDADRKSLTQPLDKVKARIMDLYRRPCEFLEQAERTIKGAILAYDAEQERKRREAEAEAARKADEERKRLAAAAAKEREAGNVETAAAIVDAAQFVAPVPVVEHAPVRVAGESHREVWSADREHVDVVALAIAIVDGKIAPDNICPNWPVIDGQVRALKGAFDMPGVRVVCKRILATRAAA